MLLVFNPFSLFSSCHLEIQIVVSRLMSTYWHIIFYFPRSFSLLLSFSLSSPLLNVCVIAIAIVVVFVVPFLEHWRRRCRDRLSRKWAAHLNTSWQSRLAPEVWDSVRAQGRKEQQEQTNGESNWTTRRELRGRNGEEKRFISPFFAIRQSFFKVLAVH